MEGLRRRGKDGGVKGLRRRGKDGGVKEEGVGWRG